LAELAYPIPPGACELEGGDASDASGPHSHIKLIFVGGSHASRMAAAAVRRGLHVANLAVPGMRISEASVEEASGRLKDELSKRDGMKPIVIYHIYDNNVFFAAGEDGSRMLPQRDPSDNKYHIPGRLEFADRNVVKNLVNISTPLLRAGGEANKIILSPMLRYAVKKCCDNKDHITNRTRRDFWPLLATACAR
jgi:hypothetical protein